MNILIPYTWLTEHLTINGNLTPQDVQKQLSLCGPAVEHITEVDGEPVFDIEVTTNRVDSMSVRGIAREAAVILSNAGFEVSLKPLSSMKVAASGQNAMPTILDPQQLCHRILTGVLEFPTNAPTPEWMQQKLHQVGISSQGFLIDVTNYVTHELGHPCHAFDYDKIVALGNSIEVREAQPGQEFTTLKNETYTTKGGEILFYNPEGTIIDVPAIIGTANTAVDQNTTRVLLWIESLPAEKVRYTSMTHALRTTAAQLNERELDPHLASDVFWRVVELSTQKANAKLVSDVVDIFPTQKESSAISVPLSEIERYLGVSLQTSVILNILQQLECQVLENNGTLTVTPPTFRTDLQIPADIVEEIARIYGYHNLPSILMPTTIPTTYPEAIDFRLEMQIAQLLADRGYQELYTYSLVSQELKDLEGREELPHVELKNMLTSDMQFLRQHIVPSHLSVMEKQWDTAPHLRGTFELANVYLPQNQALPDEHYILAIVDRSFAGLRETLDILANRLHLDGSLEISYEENPKIDWCKAGFYDSVGIITLSGRVLGMIGYTRNGQAAMELIWREILAVRKRWPAYQPIPKTAALYEDWTITLPENQPVGILISLLKNLDSTLKRVEWKDRYQNNWTFRVTFLNESTQIESKDIVPIREKAAQKIQELGGKFA